jgi:hypothetical protein
LRVGLRLAKLFLQDFGIRGRAKLFLQDFDIRIRGRAKLFLNQDTSQVRSAIGIRDTLVIPAIVQIHDSLHAKIQDGLEAISLGNLSFVQESKLIVNEWQLKVLHDWTCWCAVNGSKLIGSVLVMTIMSVSLIATQLMLTPC